MMSSLIMCVYCEEELAQCTGSLQLHALGLCMMHANRIHYTLVQNYRGKRAFYRLFSHR